MSAKVVPQSEARDGSRTHPLKAKLPSGLFRKLTTRLRPTLSHPKTPSPAVASPPLPHSPTHRSAVPVLSNDLVAVQRRQAALQQCGLVPLPRKDLSQLERELDRRFSHVVVPPQDQPEQGEPSTAEKIRREWRAKNEARSAEQSSDRDSRGPSDVASDPAEEEKTTRVSTSASSRTASSPAHPPSLRSIPEDFSFIDIPEEDDTTPEIEKSLPPVPPTEATYPLRTPLPNSSSSSSAQLPETSPSLSPRENKRLPPIDVNPRTNDTKEITDEATHGNRQSIHSLMTKSSLPALSPTMTASSFSTIPTPIDDESKERMEGMITSSSSGKARSTRLGRASDVGRNSEELNVVHETIPESPEPAATESKSLNPTKESTPTINTAGLEALVEKREKWKMSTGIFQSNRRNSGSSSKRPAGSELNLRWGAIANDFSLKAPDHPKARSSILPPTPTPADENKVHIPTQSQSAIELPRSKFSRSRSIISGFGIRRPRKTGSQSVAPSSFPLTSPPPERRPTVKIVEGREGLIRDVKSIEDDESRRLTELVFMDY